MPRAAAAIATGLLLAASFPPLGLSVCAWIALLPLLLAVRDAGAAARIALGALAGVVWACGTVVPWLLPATRHHLGVGPLAAAGLAAVAACSYGGLYVAAFVGVYPRLPRPGWLAAPATWVLLEAIRTRAAGGMPWALLGQSQSANLPLAQVAELAGVAGLSWLVVTPAAALAGSGAERRHGIAGGAGLVLAALAFGALRLAGAPPRDPSAAGHAAPRTVRAISGLNHQPDPVAAYAAATRHAGAADLTVWPEGATPGHLQDDAVAERTIARVARSDGWLLVGARRHHGLGADRRYFTGAALFTPRGVMARFYDKVHLVPIAEGAPVPWAGRLIARPFTPGSPAGNTVTAGPLRIGVLVCWEAVLSEPARRAVRDGADLLVNLSSDDGLGIGTAQQIAFTRLRAVETRRWLVRASGVGASLLIDPHGRVWPGDTLVLPPATPPPATFYVRHGDLAPRSALALLGVLAIAARVRTARRRSGRTGVRGVGRLAGSRGGRDRGAAGGTGIPLA